MKCCGGKDRRGKCERCHNSFCEECWAYNRTCRRCLPLPIPGSQEARAYLDFLVANDYDRSKVGTALNLGNDILRAVKHLPGKPVRSAAEAVRHAWAQLRDGDHMRGLGIRAA